MKINIKALFCLAFTIRLFAAFVLCHNNGYWSGYALYFSESALNLSEGLGFVSNHRFEVPEYRDDPEFYRTRTLPSTDLEAPGFRQHHSEFIPKFMPGYILLLAANFALFGRNFVAITLFQCALDAAAIVLFLSFANRRFFPGSRGRMRLLTWLLLLNPVMLIVPYAISWDALVPALAVFFIVSVWEFSQTLHDSGSWSWGWFLGTSASAVAGVYCRADFAGPFVLWLLMMLAFQSVWRKLALATVTCAVVVFCSLQPWAFYLKAKTGSYTLSNTSGGIATWESIGQVPGNRWGIVFDDWETEKYASARGWGSAFSPEANRRLHALVSKYFREDPWFFLFEAPASRLKLRFTEPLLLPVVFDSPWFFERWREARSEVLGHQRLTMTGRTRYIQEMQVIRAVLRRPGHYLPVVLGMAVATVGEILWHLGTLAPIASFLKSLFRGNRAVLLLSAAGMLILWPFIFVTYLHRYTYMTVPLEMLLLVYVLPGKDVLLRMIPQRKISTLRAPLAACVCSTEKLPKQEAVFLTLF